jgi:transposase InsO family protein
VIAADGHPVKLACRVLEVTRAGYYAFITRGPSPRAIRHAWLTDLITQIHAASRGTYGAPRVHAELRLGRGITVGHNAVAMLMRRAGLFGLPLKRRWSARSVVPTACDLVDRRFAVIEPDVLWVTDITEHPTREGKLYCCVLLDAYSRRVVGWSIDSRQTAALVTNALGMAIQNRSPTPGTIVHADHRTQFTSWAFTRRVRDAGLLASMGTVGDALDNAVMESFWARVQVELLNRRWWRTRVELANARFEYLEVFHNRQRRHSSLAMRTPIEYEILHQTRQPGAS